MTDQGRFGSFFAGGAHPGIFVTLIFMGVQFPLFVYFSCCAPQEALRSSGTSGQQALLICVHLRRHTCEHRFWTAMLAATLLLESHADSA